MKKSIEKQIEESCNAIKTGIARWEHLKVEGGQNPFWEDGINMNLVRNHIVHCKKEIGNICAINGIDFPEEYYIETPPVVPDCYMANPKKIRDDAKKWLDTYKADKNYQWLLKCNAGTNIKKQANYRTIMGYVYRLEDYIARDDLVGMRRHRNSEWRLQSFKECRDKIESAMKEDTEERQMNIFDLYSILQKTQIGRSVQMGKIDSQSQARMDGMAYALRIAKKEGVEGLDKELKRRGITGLGLPASHKEIDHELDKIKMQVLDTVLAMSCLVLRMNLVSEKRD